MAAVVLFVAVLAAIVIRLFREVAGTDAGSPVTVEWMNGLSVERYRPMLRLLDRSDLEFLKAQSGYRPEMGARLRRQRCAIFGGYLHNLAADFRRTCTALKLVMLYAETDRPELASALLRAQAGFAWRLALVRVHLVLYRLGWSDVDVTGLVRLFDGMQVELRSFVPVPATAAV